VFLSRNLDQNMPSTPVASGGSAPDPSYCSLILLQFRNLKAFVGGTQKYFAPKRRDTLAIRYWYDIILPPTQ